MIERIPELAKNKVVFDGKCNAYAAQELGFDRLTRMIDLPDVDAGQSLSQPPRGGAPAAAKPGPGAAKLGPGTTKSGPGTVKSGGAGKSVPGAEKPVPGAPQSAPGRDQRRNEFTIKFSRVATIELEELHRFLRREGPITPSCYQAIQGLSMRKCSCDFFLGG